MNFILLVGLVLLLTNIAYSKAIGKQSQDFFDFYSALKFSNKVSTKKSGSSFNNPHQYNMNFQPEKIDKFSNQDKNSSFIAEKTKRYLIYKLVFFLFFSLLRVFMMPSIFDLKNAYYVHECTNYLKYQSGLDWNCKIVTDYADKSEDNLEKYCFCWFEYECIENEQFYFDFDTEEEKNNLKESTIKAYENRCEKGMKEFTNVEWNCTIQVYDNELDIDADNLSNFDSNCDCNTNRKCQESTVLNLEDI